MTSTSSRLHNVDAAVLARHADYQNALAALPGASVIHLAGSNHSRTRAIVTLLHANEPSGFKAIHRLIQERIVPRTDIEVIVASVDAAKEPPRLSRRHLPSEEDLNRCFSPPYNTPQRQLASAILHHLGTLKPEVVIDTHNTSSHSAPFCVARHSDPVTRSWSTMFSPRMVVLQTGLGTLLEQPIGDSPVITVEFGSWMDPSVDDIAFDALHRLFTIDTPPTSPSRGDEPLISLHQPRRLLLREGARLSYGAGLVISDQRPQLTLINSIDQCNFKRLPPGTVLGWCTSEKLPIVLNPKDETVETYLTVSGSTVTTAVPLMLFMATTDAAIAAEDCIAYLVPKEDIETF
ncbi:MAG: succinylglutamate desuccinylase/aspartoacylase family protein [Pseudomonadota bacterium]